MRCSRSARKFREENRDISGIFRGYFALPQHSVYLHRVLALLAWDEYEYNTGTLTTCRPQTWRLVRHGRTFIDSYPQSTDYMYAALHHKICWATMLSNQVRYVHTPHNHDISNRDYHISDPEQSPPHLSLHRLKFTRERRYIIT